MGCLIGAVRGSSPFDDVPADRAAIQQVINSLNTAKPVSALFTDAADSKLDR